MNVTITARTTVATGVVALSLKSGDDLPPWRPGAHVDVTLPNGLTRQYSLCGDPADRSTWRIAVLLEESSRGGSAWVHTQAFEGDALTVSAPRNLFDLVAAERYVFIAGGVGITPILPMIAEAERSGIPWTLWYSGKSSESMAFTDELGRYGDRVRLVPGGRVPVDEVLATPAPETAVYCCGPESMVEAVENACRTWEPGTLHVERFTAATSQDGSFDVHLERSGVDVRVEDGVSVLDALLEAGVEADYSCTQGFCGTCETRVLEGVPEHRDDYLDHSAPTDTMMICVSRSRCARLVLDL